MKHTIFHYDSADKNISEDFTIADENIFVVTDGFSAFFDEETISKGHGKKAAEIAGNSIFSYIKENIDGTSDYVNVLVGAYKEANKKVRTFNESLGANYTKLDFLNAGLCGCVCSYGFVNNNTIFFAQINDCGVMVFDQQKNREVDFIYNQKSLISYIAKVAKEKNFEKGSLQEHVFIRKEVMNNFYLEYLGANAGFGAMTGQEESLKFLHYGSSHFFKNQKAIFYTDGFIPFVYSSDFIGVLMGRSGKEVLDFIESKVQKGDKQCKKEKSLILVNL